MEELPKIVWGLRTQQSRATRQSPFFLVFRSKAILSSDLIQNSPRIEQYNEGEAHDTRRLEIDSLEEARIVALFQSARYQQGLRRYHDKSVQHRSFQVGDQVLRHIQNTTGLHRQSSPWKGPFIVSKITRPGSYQLCTDEGVEVPNLWHIEHLRKFYP